MNKVIILVFVALCLSGCNSKPAETTVAETDSNEVALTEAQLKNAAIETGKPESKTLSSVLKVNGVIEVPPQNMISVSVPMAGYLKSTQLLPGMHVAKGEVIAVVEDLQYIQLQQDYLTAKARLTYNQGEYNRQRELNKTKASSDKVFEMAEADYQSQQATVRGLYEKLRLLSIDPDKLTADNISRGISLRSPIDGFVSKVNVNIGKYVNPTDILFELVNPADIHLNLTVFEKDLDKLAIGQKLLAYTNNSTKKHPCEIILIGKNLSADRSTEVHCHFEKYDHSLIPGMYMNAEVSVQSTGALAVPEGAIVDYAGKQYVFEAMPGNRYQMIEVQTGLSENGYMQISSNEVNLADKTLVTKNAYTVFMKKQNKSDE
ncbi:MAG: efflux RND transporter periplasmic adaptor subunit [Chitinophagales bacterium]|nr:efflux RND transporter periplasmic adaptor subunit [Chitinophagales bacterium]